MKKPSAFKKLQKQWYKKLKDEGFKDIEYFRNGEPGEWLRGNSKFSDEESALAMTPQEEERANINYQTTFEYYQAARGLLHNPNNFRSDIDYSVWELHSEGHSLRAIGKFMGFSHSKVMRIIDNYRKHYFGINK
jgi:hypothetical protein